MIVIRGNANKPEHAKLREVARSNALTVDRWHSFSFCGHPERRRKRKGRRRTDDHATASRTPVPHLRDPVSFADRGVDELVWRQADRFSRARGGYAAAAVSDPYLQSLWLLRRRSRLHRGR